MSAKAAKPRGVRMLEWLCVAVVLLAVADVVVTAKVLSLGGHEANPVAAAALSSAGIAGMVALKSLAMVVFLAIIAVLRHRTMRGTRLLAAVGVAAQLAVVAVGLTIIPRLQAVAGEYREGVAAIERVEQSLAERQTERRLSNDDALMLET
ncbi:MAG: DUF5658 family protein [Planctomycetota bacterium]